MQLRLPAKQPFSLGSVIRSHGWAKLAPFTMESDALSYVMQMASGHVVAFAIREASGGVTVDIPERLAEPESAQIARAVTRMLGLHQDLTPFYALVRSERKLAHVQEQGLGRLLCAPSVWEDTVKAILTTNVSWANTVRMVEHLVSGLGAPLLSDPSRKAFPTPAQIAQTDLDTLGSTARLGYRTAYVHQLARSIARGDRDLQALSDPDRSTKDVRRELLGIKGVGTYAAASILMLLGRYDHVPVDSWGLKRASHEWYQDERITPDQVEAAFEHWGRWKGLAYWLWDWSTKSDE